MVHLSSFITPVVLTELVNRGTHPYFSCILVYKNVFMAWRRYTSLTNFTIQQSWSFEGVCVPLRLMNCISRTRLSTYGDRAFPVAAVRIWILEQSSAAYHICSVTSRLLLSLEDIRLRALLPVITVVVPAK